MNGRANAVVSRKRLIPRYFYFYWLNSVFLVLVKWKLLWVTLLLSNLVKLSLVMVFLSVHNVNATNLGQLSDAINTVYFYEIVEGHTQRLLHNLGEQNS